VLLDAEEMTLEEAVARLARAYAGRPSRPLFFNAEDGVRYQQAFRVLDAAHGAGVNTIGVMTDPPITPRSAGSPAAAGSDRARRP
jgi:biopolymer transport protein ExbD